MSLCTYVTRVERHATPPRKVKTGQEDPRHKKVNPAYVAAYRECRQEQATFKW